MLKRLCHNENNSILPNWQIWNVVVFIGLFMLHYLTLVSNGILTIITPYTQIGYQDLAPSLIAVAWSIDRHSLVY
jgi:hypothetical protein